MAIRCTFLEVHTMSGYRFRVVLCDYERYIMSLYMYYRVVGKTLNVFAVDNVVRKHLKFEIRLYKNDRGNGHSFVAVPIHTSHKAPAVHPSRNARIGGHAFIIHTSAS